MYLLLKLKRPLWNPSCYSACLPSSRFDLPARSSSSARRLLPPRGLTIAEISLGPDEGERKQHFGVDRGAELYKHYHTDEG